MGEDKLLEILWPRLATGSTAPSLRSELIVGAGDDGAVWRPSAEWAAVVTTDSLVEEVHFHTPGDGAAGEDIGWKLLAVSYSDLAAMGARPGPSFVSLAVPAAWRVSWIEALYTGMEQCLVSFGGALAGGNISSAAAAVFTSTCVGEVDPARILRRSGAGPGWRLAVTGTVGGAAAALRLAHDPDAGPAPDDANPDMAAMVKAWQRRLRRPQPRIHAAALAAAQGVATAIDVSDGLFVDAGRLLGPGATGLVIDPDEIPVAPGVRETWPNGWLDLAGGGEDYELLLAGPPEPIEAAVEALAGSVAPARVIGAFDAGDGVRVRDGGAEIPAPAVGHQHFAS